MKIDKPVLSRRIRVGGWNPHRLCRTPGAILCVDLVKFHGSIDRYRTMARRFVQGIASQHMGLKRDDEGVGQQVSFLGCAEPAVLTGGECAIWHDMTLCVETGIALTGVTPAWVTASLVGSGKKA